MLKNLSRFVFIFSLLLICLFITVSPVFADITSTATVSVGVPAHSSSFPVTVSLDGNSPILQDSERTFKIEYGSNLSYQTALTLTAYWSQGTIDGDSAPSLDIVDYVVGSATNGVNSTAPVIDTTNNSITWTFSSFPANSTGNSVSFKLKTNSSYKESKKVNFEIKAVANANSVTNSSSINPYYLYNSGSLATSTPTPTPTTETASPTPAKTAEQLSFENVNVRTISETAATIFVQASKPSKFILTYGTLQSLNKIVSTTDFNISKTMELIKLAPNTQYFFQVKATAADGKSQTSDIFSFKTSKFPNVASVNLSTIVVVSGNNIVFDSSAKSATNSATNNIVIIPQNTVFQFKFAITKAEAAENVRLVLRKITGKTVLGENSFNFIPLANAASVSVLEVEPGVYSASISSNVDPGVYQLLTQYRDSFGNLTEEDLAVIKITNPFTLKSGDGAPIEGARILLSAYSEQRKKYIPLSSSFLNIENPQFTNNKGVAIFTLPKGKYKAQVFDINYNDKTVYFDILEGDKSGYPTVILTKAPFTPGYFIRYYWHSFTDVFLAHFGQFVLTLATSLRFFDLISGLTLFILVLITLYAFIRKNNIAHFPSYILYLSHHLTNSPNKESYIKGLIREKNGAPISGVHIYLIDDKSQEVISNTKTDSNGEFFFRKGDSTYYLIAMKKGYFSTSQIEAKEHGFIEYEMEKRKGVESSITYYLHNFIGGLLGLSFELLLLTTLFFELIFVSYFGIEKIAPFILISLFNIVVWVMHLRHARHHPTRIR